MPMSVVMKHGWVFQPSTLTNIRSYNNETAPVAGVLKCSLKFGPMRDAQEVEFLIANGLTNPIIGMGTLQSCGMSVNCATRMLQTELARPSNAR